MTGSRDREAMARTNSVDFFAQRPPAQPARLIAGGGNRRVIQGRVRGDNSSDAVLLGGRDDLFQLGERKIGRDFQQHWFRASLIFVTNGAEQLLERFVFLQRAEAGRVRRADVEDNVIGERGQEAERIKIIRHRLFDRRDLRFADVDADGDGRPAAALAQFSQARRDDVGAVVVKPEAVDQRALLWITENARLRIPGLGLRGNGADLDKAKAERGPGGNRDSILVEAGSEADRVWESKPENGSRFRRRLETFEQRAATGGSEDAARRLRIARSCAVSAESENRIGLTKRS